MKNTYKGVLATTLAVMLFSVANGQNYNFNNEGGKIVWRHVYESSLPQPDQFDKVITSIGVLKPISKTDSTAVLDLTDYVYHRSGYKCSGRVVIESKPGRYRVSVYSITYKPSASAALVVTSLTGGNAQFVWDVESAFLRKNGQFRTNPQIQDMDGGLLSLFDFKVPEEKKDW